MGFNLSLIVKGNLKNMENLSKILEHDTSGMDTYEYIVNHAESCREELPKLIENLNRVDNSGQFLASTARFLHAVDSETFDEFLPKLIECAIDKDRERRYIGALLEAIWGSDYLDRKEQLISTDNNFRRIYKRVFPPEAQTDRIHCI